MKYFPRLQPINESLTAAGGEKYFTIMQIVFNCIVTR